MARLSSCSKPRRFGISSRKSVLAEASNSSICASASLSFFLSLLASVKPSARRGTEAEVGGEALRRAARLLRFAGPDAGLLVFFSIGLLKGQIRPRIGASGVLFGWAESFFETLLCVNVSHHAPRRLARPHQDRIVHCRLLASPVLTFVPCRGGFVYESQNTREKKCLHARANSHHHGKPVGLGNHASRRRYA